ncbi:MAG TPA: signal peptidase I [Acidimicrobiales bacterium]|nr:signal peptidase I [Acidimicrobiales bacterium]
MAPPRATRFGHLLLSGFAVLLSVVIGVGLVVGPRLLSYRVLYVRTASMTPALPVGSLVVVTEARADDIGPGDVITFAHPDGGDRLVTHRVVAREAGAFVTKGDAGTAVDPWRVPARGTGWRVALSVPLAGFVLGYLQSEAVGTWAFGAVVTLLAARVVVGIWRPSVTVRPLGV